MSWKFVFPPLIVLGEKDIALAVYPLYSHRRRVPQAGGSYNEAQFTENMFIFKES